MKTITKDDNTLGVFEKIQLEEAWVVVDKEANKSIGDKVLYLVEPKGFNPTKQILTLLDVDEFCGFEEDGGKGSVRIKYCSKIISASKSLIDKYRMNLPEFISLEEQEIEKLAEKYISENYFGKTKLLEVFSRDAKAFIAGYKANQNKFSEEDLENAYDLGKDSVEDARISFKKILQSLQTKECYLEVEEKHCSCEYCDGNGGGIHDSIWQLKLTDNKVFEV